LGDGSYTCEVNLATVLMSGMGPLHPKWSKKGNSNTLNIGKGGVFTGGSASAADIAPELTWGGLPLQGAARTPLQAASFNALQCIYLLELQHDDPEAVSAVLVACLEPFPEVKLVPAMAVGLTNYLQTQVQLAHLAPAAATPSEEDAGHRGKAAGVRIKRAVSVRVKGAARGRGRRGGRRGASGRKAVSTG
jgi:hypothetical protein